jgi:hypothetical protein
MSAAAKWGIALAMLVFVAGVVYLSIPRAPYSCEVCLEFRGEMVCRRGAGETEEAARMAAQESTCGGNAHGMSELIACRNRTPDRLQCTGP